MHTCPTCTGTRRITITVPNMLGPSNNRYQSAIRPFVDRHYVCETCNGTGTVACVRCRDTGEVDTGDSYGAYAGPTYCACDTGIVAFRAEQDRMTAEAAEWHQRAAASRYDDHARYDALHRQHAANSAAGCEPF